ncbi:MAG: V-type ATPase subunit [Spirochaetales bacterium]|nr:V-type ATPase subunit [Spirochaetales bacterium]
MGALQTYAFINAKLRGRISKILPEEVFGQMARAGSVDEAVQMLRDTGFAAVEEAYHRTGDIKTAELELVRREAGLYRELNGLVVDELKPFVDALAGRFEIGNLKNALRLWFDANVRKRNVEGRAGYLLRERIRYPMDVDAVVNAPTLQDAAAALSGTPYAALIAREASGVLESGTLFDLEIALDQLFYEQLGAALETLSERDRAVARRLIGVEIDIENIGWLIRFKSFYDMSLEQALARSIPRGLNLSREAIAEAYTSQSPGAALAALVRKRYPELSALLSTREGSGEEASARAGDSRGRSGGEGPGGTDGAIRHRSAAVSRLALIERVLREILLIEVRRILGGYPFTVGVIMAYFILKGEEIRRIMTLLNAKFYGWSDDRIVSAL